MNHRITEAVQQLVKAQVDYALTVLKLNSAGCSYEIRPSTTAIDLAKGDLDRAIADHGIKGDPSC